MWQFGWQLTREPLGFVFSGMAPATKNESTGRAESRRGILFGVIATERRVTPRPGRNSDPGLLPQTSADILIGMTVVAVTGVVVTA